MNSFWISPYPVSFAEYREYAQPMDWDDIPESIPGTNAAAVSVPWTAAVNFCNWLSARDALTPVYRTHELFTEALLNANGYRLPTTAEMETAIAWTGGAALRTYNAETHWEWCWDSRDGAGTAHLFYHVQRVVVRRSPAGLERYWYNPAARVRRITFRLARSDSHDNSAEKA